MSIFDDNITSKTRLQEFYDRIKEVIQDNFERIYMSYIRDKYSLDFSLRYTTSILNHEINKFQMVFAEFGMYQPWLCCTPIADVNPSESKFSISVFYSEEPSIYIHDTRKEFLHMCLPLPNITLSNITTDNYESVR